jgi:hypothetical protein
MLRASVCRELVAVEQTIELALSERLRLDRLLDTRFPDAAFYLAG